MLRILIVSLLLCLIAQAGTYPRLFSQMGTPLYEAQETFERLEETGPLKVQIEVYCLHASRLLDIGRDIESGRDVEKQELQDYFSALRQLQKEHDAVISALRGELRSAIEKDDYARVKKLSTSGIEMLFTQPSLQKLLVEYYEKKRHLGKIAFLETMAKELKAKPRRTASSSRAVEHASSDRTVEQPRRAAPQEPANELVLLTTSWCPACKNAKATLRSHRIAFREYDIERSSEGKRLYKERNGHAIPMLIIGDDYRTGLNMGWVKERLK